MQDEFPSPYPVWPKMGFDEWLRQSEFDYLAKLHNACHEQMLEAWDKAFNEVSK